MTADEIQTHEIAANEFIADLEKQENEKAVREAARLAILAKLGLTADEITALFG